MDDMGLYVVYDRVAEDFAPTFESSTDGSAVRAVRAMATKQGLRPQDYLLYRIGRVARSRRECKVIGMDGMIELEWREQPELELEVKG